MRLLYVAVLISLAVTLLVLWYAKTHVERLVEEKKQSSWIGRMFL